MHPASYLDPQLRLALVHVVLHPVLGEPDAVAEANELALLIRPQIPPGEHLPAKLGILPVVVVLASDTEPFIDASSFTRDASLPLRRARPQRRQRRRLPPAAICQLRIKSDARSVHANVGRLSLSLARDAMDRRLRQRAQFLLERLELRALSGHRRHRRWAGYRASHTLSKRPRISISWLALRSGRHEGVNLVRRHLSEQIRLRLQLQLLDCREHGVLALLPLLLDGSPHFSTDLRHRRLVLPLQHL
jgi:hypothetical protein